MIRERTALIKAREKLGLTRPQLAKRMGRARSYIFLIETGASDPGLPTMIDWLGVLGPEASIELFEPHPQVAIWSKLLTTKVKRTIAKQLVA